MSVPLFSALRRFTVSATGRRVLAVCTVVAVVLMACNAELAPLAALVDMVGLDVLALVLGSQLMAALPWLTDHARGALQPARRVVVGLVAGAMGGYLRQLLFGLAQRTVTINWRFGGRIKS
ncbi:MAG: hypothetical protein ACRER5_20255 [Pseudomonas sp.]